MGYSINQQPSGRSVETGQGTSLAACNLCAWRAQMRGGDEAERLEFLSRALRAHIEERHPEPREE